MSGNLIVDDAHSSASGLPGGVRRRRDDLLGRLLIIIQQDERVRAAWLSGSFGRGMEDDWSDLDLHVAVADHACGEQATG